MGNLADLIESYIRAMLESAHQDTLELQRQELAKMFDCVPSQINYVLSTRFTADRGYMVESRRGGGGFIRIARMRISAKEAILGRIFDIIGDSIGEKDAQVLLARLENEDIIEPMDVVRIRVTLMRELDDAPDLWREALRARMLRALLGIVLGGE